MSTNKFFEDIKNRKDKERNISKNNSRNVSNDGNKITIEKKTKDKGEEIKRASYYLKKKHIKNINKYSKKANMKKSEFVNYLFDKVFAELEIE